MARLIAAAATALVASVAAPSSSPVDPRLLVLRQNDVPAGFSPAFRQYVPTPAVDHEYAARGIRTNFARLGRIRGYEIRFDRQRRFRTDVVVSSASVYRTVGGARKAFAVLTRAVPATAARTLTRISPGGRIGSQTRVWRAAPGPHGALSVTAVLVLWRSRTALGLVDVGGIGSGAGRTLALRLAHRQQAHIAAAHL